MLSIFHATCLGPVFNRQPDVFRAVEIAVWGGLFDLLGVMIACQGYDDGFRGTEHALLLWKLFLRSFVHIWSPQ